MIQGFFLLWMAEIGRRRPDVIQDYFQEKESIPEVLYSAVETEDPPSPVPKRLHLEIGKNSWTGHLE